MTAEYNLNYNNLFCLAVGAIKELKAEVDTLKQYNLQLENRIQAIESV